MSIMITTEKDSLYFRKLNKSIEEYFNFQDYFQPVHNFSSRNVTYSICAKSNFTSIWRVNQLMRQGKKIRLCYPNRQK